MKKFTFRVTETMMVLALAAIQSFAQSTYEPYTFTTLAGGGGFSSPDVPGTAARFFGPNGVAVDSAGNLYVTDTFNNAIRKVAPVGTNWLVTTLAGLPGSFGSADGTGSEARFYYADRLTVDSTGNVYVADGNQTIRKVTPEGVVTTLAGLAGHPGSADGTNSAARFNGAEGLAVDSAGNIYVADAGNCTVRKVTPVGTNWVVTTIAGRPGVPGSSNGTNGAARFSFAHGLAIDSSGNLYVGDTDNYTIRMVTPVGTNWVVTTVAGLARDPGSVDGIGSAARFDIPVHVVADSAGNLYVADQFNDAIRKLTRVGTDWMVTTVAGLGGVHGSADGIGRDARFSGPSSVAVDSAGSVYVADQVNHTVRKVTSAGMVTTLAGLAGYAGSQNGTGTVARFNAPHGVAVDMAGNVYVSGDNTIRKVTPAGVVTTIAGAAGAQGDADGFGSGARFGSPYALAVDSATNLYVADALNHTIRKVTPSGSVTTRAGLAGADGSADGTGTVARFNNPSGVAVDSATNIYVADTWNHTIRKVTPARVVTTIAGRAGSAGSADGMGNDARFNYPSGIAVDSAGNLYVADAYNNTIRKLTPVGTDWVVTTLGGMPGFYGTADGIGSTARFSNPNGVAVDSAGNLYVADFYFNTIRKGSSSPRIINSGFVGGNFSFNLTGPPGQLAVVEASTDLRNWLPLWTNTFGGTLNFSDSQSAGSSHRFYRARTP